MDMKSAQENEQEARRYDPPALNDPPSIWPRFLGLVVPLALGSIALLHALHNADLKLAIEKLKYAEQVHVEIASRSIHESLAGTLADLTYLSSQHRFDEAFAAQAEAESVRSAHDHSYKPFRHLEQDWLSFSRERGRYDQIRYLDEKGMERIRVDYHGGSPAAVPASQLQDKSGRYYFSDTFKLNPDQVFVSPLDLNIERGEIERPFKPMLRLGKPIIDDGGNKRGVVILNYLAAHLFETLDAVYDGFGGEVWLLNSKGYWIKGPEDLAWAFMWHDDEKTMSALYPRPWQNITSAPRGQFQDRMGIWTYSQIAPVKSVGVDAIVGPEPWTLVFILSDQILSAEFRPLRDHYFQLTLIALLCVVVGSAIIARFWTARKRLELSLWRAKENLEDIVARRTEELHKEKERAIQLSNTDELTGLKSRRSFFEQARQVGDAARRYQRIYAVIMMDIDLFKSINDSYGHQAGDQVLREVARCINDTIRSTDIAGRVGGEEFCVILPETSLDDALKLAERLRQCVAASSVLYRDQHVVVTASFGVAQLSDVDESLETVMSRSDAALYQSKRLGRNRVAIDHPEARSSDAQ